MSLLPFLTILIHILVAVAQARPDLKGAEALMQIQRVLDLSAEIAKAEEVTVSDISTAESKYTKKRQYAVPEGLLRLVGNTITDLKSQQASASPNGVQSIPEAASYVTPTPDIRVQSEESGNYAIAPFSSQQQRQEQQQTSSTQLESSQQYALGYSFLQGQQYTLSPDVRNHYELQSPQGQQYVLQSNSLDSSNYGHAQNQQYVIPSDSAQRYNSQVEQNQGYQQYSVSQVPQYQIVKQPAVAYSQSPHSHSYVTTYAAPTSPALAEVAQVVSPQSQGYQSAQALAAYRADPHHHYAIAAQQAEILSPQHKPQQHMYYLGGHSQTGTYTEAVIHGGNNAGQYVPEPASQLTVPKAPVQINIHPQAYSLVNSYRGASSGAGQSSYMPLQILINHLAEPAKYSQPGISAPGGPEQPKMPIYHYSPVPVGTIKDEHVPEMRIKSTHTPPNPHSDKYKDYPSSPPLSSSLAMPPASSFSAMAQSEGPSLQPVKATQTAQPDWDDEEFIKYDFGYRVSDENHKLEFGKTESKKDGVTKGSYHVLLPDGRLQVVKYWSDHTGYHTDISYKVPGVDGKK